MKRINPQIFDNLIPDSFIKKKYFMLVASRVMMNRGGGAVELDNIIYYLVRNKLQHEAHISKAGV